MKKTVLKKIGIYAGVLLLFIGLAYGFTPEVLDGKIVNQGDISQWKGMANEAMTHNEAHPEDPTAWSNAMFGGMPTTATIDSFEGDWTDSIYDFLLTGRRPASYLLIALIGGFLLMLSLGTSTLIAVGGAIAMAFCSYNFQIITAGHNTKMQAIAYFPWVLAAVIFTYKAALRSFAGAQDDKGSAQDDKGSAQDDRDRKSWLPKVILGAVLFAFALSFQIKANHIQITYYLAIVIFAYILGLFIYLCIDKARRSTGLKNFFIASAVLLVTGGIGIATNANKLIPTYEYSKYTMRGGSELSSDRETHNKDGLDIEYATQWSYGIEEMPNLLIPNFNGGSSSQALDVNSEAGKALQDIFQMADMSATEARHLAQNYIAREYWGPQPMTSGPMYMGAVTIFLFVLGVILCKGREKWWLLAAMIFSIFLAWGNHFMAFTEFCFNHLPMYNKFRTVSMILIVLQVLMPMLGFYALDKIIKNTYEKRKVLRASAIAFVLTAGFCLLAVAVPSIAGDYMTEFDSTLVSNMFGISNQELMSYGVNVDGYTSAVAAHRVSLMIADALRSFVIILIAAALIILPYYIKGLEDKKWRTYLAGCVILVVLFDLWSVGKRYLNSDNFVEKKDFEAIYSSGEDPYGLGDSDLHFRVLDIPNFGNAVTSYYYNTIGGYSAVKMQRYQDLIDRYLSTECSSVNRYGLQAEEQVKISSMLNAKYVITGGEILDNPYALGNAWFVNDYVSAATPDDEIALLKDTDLSTTAVIGKDFEWARRSFADAQDDKTDTQDDKTDTQDDNSCHSEQSEESFNHITLTHYAPNELRYDFSTDSERAAVFSEVYYPKGWKAWIEPEGTYGEVVDGRYQPTAQAEEVDIFRANWILRGVVLPEGEGTLIMRFEPQSYVVGENTSRISSILLILLLIGSAGAMIWLARRK